MKNEIITPKEWSRLGFELAYLAALTREGLKPLSRWEDRFDHRTQDALQSLGLKTRVVERSARSGRTVRELIFSPSDRCLDLYASRFHHTFVGRTPSDMRFEGRLFGYPACCVESFVTRGYATNTLRRAEQRILFHWACPRCVVTPQLLPQYRRIYHECRRLTRGHQPGVSRRLPPEASNPLKRAVALAASLAALATAPAGGGPGMPSPDPHWLPLESWEDPDCDLMSSAEEYLLEKDPANADENHNQQPDGADLARRLSTAIDALPTKASTTQTYVTHHLAFGLENCQVCGAVTNMGSLEIVNPLENQSFPLPYVAKHFLEHGSFTHVGTNSSGVLHSGRLNPALLQTVLTSAGLAHFIADPPGSDTDNDGLYDWEEPVFQTDPAVRDSNGDQVIDGIEVMRLMRAQLNALPRASSPETGPKDRPFVVEHPMDGIETCPRCGERVVMDVWDVFNPVSHARISIPSMALHYLEHGGSSWEGGQLMGGAGRVDPRQLRAVLTGLGDGHWLHVQPDTDGDLLTDGEESELKTNPQAPDENANQVLDGVDLAKQIAAETALLPTGPVTSAHRLDFPLRGLERCEICGTNVNMGHLTVCNPLAQLYVHLPYITLHYLEHGSFSFAGDLHGAGRTDVKLLLDSLHTTGPGHLRAIGGDQDADGLTDFEERHFQLDESHPDTDGDGVPDGFQLAHKMWEAIAALPRTENSTGYAVEHPEPGIVSCDICGAQVNLGCLELVNPQERLRLTLPHLALHFLRHGGLAWTPQDRVNPCLLDIALRGDGTSHLVLWPGDSDGDGLLDAEEAHFGTRADNADSNDDGVLDGIEVARRLHQRIQALPIGLHSGGKYRQRFEANCFEPCPVCGETINCGHEIITNAWVELSLQVSFMNLHYLEHGGLAVSAAERVDPNLLDAVLQPPVMITTGEGGVTLRWTGQVGRTYQVFTEVDVTGPWTPGPVFSGTGSDVTFTDVAGTGLPRKFYEVRKW